MMKHNIISFFFSIAVVTASAQNATTIAIIEDGQSWYFERLKTEYMQQVKALLGATQSVTFRQFSTPNYQSATISNNFDTALADPTVDLIYANGVIATELALKQATAGLDKPVIGGALQVSNTLNEFITATGKSKLENYTFIVNPRRVVSDLELLAKYSGEQTIHVLLDEAYLQLIENRADLTRIELYENKAITINFVAASPSVTATLQRIPADAKAVYVTVLPRYTPTARKQLYQGLSHKKIMTIAMAGKEGVEAGALFGLAPVNFEEVARRAAVNTRLILSGKPANQLHVYFPVQDQLFINDATAQQVGWSPDYDTMLLANVIGREARFVGEAMNLKTAFDMAKKENQTLAVSRANLDIAHSRIDLVQSALLPQLSAVGSYRHSRFTDRINPITTPAYTNNASIGLQLNQVLFQDELWANWGAQQDLAESTTFDLLSNELDIIEATASAYFNCLATAALYEIERSNLELTNNHYQLAKLRITIGAAEPAEVYRWEQLQLQGKANLIARESNRRSAIARFNRLLSLPPETRWNFAAITISEDELYFLDDLLGPMINSSAQFQKFAAFLQVYAVDNAPELISFDLQLQAQGLLLDQARRQFYLPVVALTAGIDRAFSGTDNIDMEDETQGFVGIQVSLPLFEGGGRWAEIAEQRGLVRLLKAQRTNAIEQIRENTAIAINDIRSSHPNFRLNRLALQSAEANYRSVNEKYAQGAASFLDILDAQQALLQQRQTTTVAEYDYLTNIHRLQRSIAWFEYDKTSNQRMDFISLFKRFITNPNE